MNSSQCRTIKTKSVASQSRRTQVGVLYNKPQLSTSFGRVRFSSHNTINPQQSGILVLHIIKLIVKLSVETEYFVSSYYTTTISLHLIQQTLLSITISILERIQPVLQ